MFGTPIDQASPVRFTNSRPETFTTVFEASLDSFARLQSFDGSFADTPGLFKIIARQEQAPQMPQILADLQCEDALKESVWRTLLCVASIEAKFSEDRDVWDVMVGKALDYVTNALEGHSEDLATLVIEVKAEAANCVSV